MEMPHVSAVFLRVLIEYGENAFVLHRQVVTQTHRRGVETVAQSKLCDWYIRNI
jgi:hypothetical protein